MATLHDQLEWERHCKSEGLRKLKATLQKAREQGRLTDTPIGNVVLRKYILAYSKAIAKDITDDLNSPGVAKQAVPLLYALDVDGVALLTLSTVVNMLAQNDNCVPLTKMAYNIGKYLNGELILATFRDLAPDLYEVIIGDFTRRLSRDLDYRLTVFKQQAKENEIEIQQWTKRQRVLVGTYLLNILISDSFEFRLLDLVTTFNGKKTQHAVTPTETLREISVELIGMLEYATAVAAPCLIEPQDWTGEPNKGGFHGALKIKAPRFYKGPSGNIDIMNYYNADLSRVYKMLNTHQKVKWKINPFIFNLVSQMEKRGYSIKKIVEFQSGIRRMKPERPSFLDKGVELTPAQEEEFKIWKKHMRDYYIEENRVGRVEARGMSVLEAARRMLREEYFYFTYQVDYRGRMYPVSGILNPQGSDIQKAMIHAAVGEPIDTEEALWWFKLSLAAKYGIDKLSPDECVKWVDDNHYNIIRAASDPLDRDAFNWWSDADKPLQFIAVCDEYKRYHESPETFLNRIAVSMDGSCNGLQNYSALLRDYIGGLATNLVATEDGKPNDIYKEVAKAAYKRLLKMPDSDLKELWKEHIVDRKITKKPVMTQVYGSTYGTCRDSVLEYIYDKGIFLDAEYEAAVYAADLIWEAIGDVVVKASEAMAWLREATSAILRQQTNGISPVIVYPAPSGFIIVQDYVKQNTIRVRTHVGRDINLFVTGNGNYKVNKVRHRNSTPPNFIHGVDGSHMTFTTCAMADLNIPDLFLHFIHDDYGVLAKHAGTLARVLREQFVNMHSEYDISMFGKFYKDLPKPPEKGDLNLECVLESPNFFR